MAYIPSFSCYSRIIWDITGFCETPILADTLSANHAFSDKLKSSQDVSKIVQNQTIAENRCLG